MAIRGGLSNKIVRLRVFDIPRHVSRELSHTAIRAFKTEALHFHLDLRRPELRRVTGLGSPGGGRRFRSWWSPISSVGLCRPSWTVRPSSGWAGDLMDSVERDLTGA